MAPLGKWTFEEVSMFAQFILLRIYYRRHFDDFCWGRLIPNGVRLIQFVKWRQATGNFVMSVCPSACKQLGSHWMDFHKYDILVFFSRKYVGNILV
jgi:hypothetical protein